MTSPGRKPCVELEVRGELGDRGRLADPRRSHEGDDAARAGHGGDRRRDRHARFDRLAKASRTRLGPMNLVGLELLGHVPHQPAGQHLGHVGFEQLGVHRHERRGEFGEQVVDPSGAAQRLDHRVQPAELLAEAGVQAGLNEVG